VLKLIHEYCKRTNPKGTKRRAAEIKSKKCRRIKPEGNSKINLQTNWRKINNLHVYSPLPSLNEVDTLPLITYLKTKHKGIYVFIEAQSEPKSIPDKKFDLIIVPTLGFDEENFRLGWGGGYYDKFLATQPQAQKIGLCFQSGFIKEGFPHEIHDIPLDKIITEV
jgi:5-formyltetrahydrofolate cyclo-ligase